jgi:hypothetical protein
VLRITNPKGERPRASTAAVAKAQRVPEPADIAALALLDRVDYADAFEIQAPDTRSAGEWTRFVLDTAPPALLSFVRAVQQLLGFQLAPVDRQHPLGWTIVREDQQVIVLAAEGRAGSARLVGSTRDDRLCVTTMLRLDSRRSRAAWSIVAPIHRKVARYLLDRSANAATAVKPQPSVDQPPAADR